MQRIFIPIILLIVLAGGGYWGFNQYYYAPQQVLARTNEQLAKLTTVHADMDISSTVRVIDQKGLTQTQTGKLTGFSDINIQNKTQKMHLTVSSNGQSQDTDMVLLQGGQMYSKMPALGDFWIAINTKTLKDIGALPIDPQSSDYITQSLGFLKSANKDAITRLEDEVVDGVKAARYRVDISTVKYIEFLKQLSDNTAFIDAYKDANIKTDVWIDQKTDRMLKMESDIKNLAYIDSKTKAKAGSIDMLMKLSYSKYNQELNIAKPDGKIVEYEDLMKAMGQGRSQ